MSSRAAPVVLAAVLFCHPASTAADQSNRFSAVAESLRSGVVELKGQVALDVGGARVPKRFVLRYPSDRARWNGSLVIGAHGGSGGNNFDPTGKVIGTDETALDDVIGRHATSAGFAYASVDRDGAIDARGGLALTSQFADVAAGELASRLGRGPARLYLVGLSMGGGIARVAAEDPAANYAGIVIIAGAGGDLPTRTARQQQLATLWPGVDPKRNPGLADTDPRVVAFAEAIGTPVAARRLWPYTAANAANAATRPASPSGENSSGKIHVPTIEVVGTWDDFVLKELLAYRRRVDPRSLHRLYQVEGVWHMSGDDDGVQSFMYIATRMGLDPDVARAMGEGPSYLPTVREAFDRLVRWVEHREPPPSSQTVKAGEKLR
ncbi:MAG: alpha/beta hydrolase domain-containing protein [Vicinamibacterales bacterium]